MGHFSRVLQILEFFGPLNHLRIIQGDVTNPEGGVPLHISHQLAQILRQPKPPRHLLVRHPEQGAQTHRATLEAFPNVFTGVGALRPLVVVLRIFCRPRRPKGEAKIRRQLAVDRHAHFHPLVPATSTLPWDDLQGRLDNLSHLTWVPI